jgi:hypothetical protein
MVEIFFGVLLPLGLFAYAIRHNRPGLVRFTAFLTIFGVALNRINTALIAFNWNLYQEIPGWREVVICLTLFSVYLVTYRFILYRLPIVYSWKEEPALAEEPVTEKVSYGAREPMPVELLRVSDK